MKLSDFLNNPKTGNLSLTRAAFSIGFSICCLKLLVSGVSFLGLSFSAFSGVDFAAAVTAVGALYQYNTHQLQKKDDSK